MLIFLALLPAIVLVVKIYKQDKIEKEPVNLLFKIFMLGALSILPAIVLEEALGAILGVFWEETSYAYIVVEAFVVVAVSEEYCKMKAAKFASWKHPAFNYKFDAIVYCVSSALGFAALENIFYVIDGGLFTAVTRALLSVPSHAIDGVIMGYFFGVAKEAELQGNKAKAKKNLRLSVLIPAVEHGIYDCSLSLDSGWILLFFFVFVIVVDIWAIKLVKKQSKEDVKLEKYDI